MSYFQPAFNPNAQFRVTAWRGLSVPGDLDRIEQGEMIPAGLIDARTLSILYRQRSIEMVIAEPIQDPESDDPPAPITDADEEATDAQPAPDAAPPKRGRGRPRKDAA
jgi:hypothetical protein